MKVVLLTGAPGTQKTRTMLREALQRPGQYLFSCPRIDLIEEQSVAVQSMAAEAGIALPAIRVIHSENGQRGSVRRQMADAAVDLAAAQHVMVFITHDGLRDGDLQAFAGWEVRIDEIPHSVRSGNFAAGAAYSYLDALYRLEPFIPDDWWLVVPREETPTINEVMHDEWGKEFVPWHKEVLSQRGVFVNVGNWRDAKGKGRIKWWSLWTPLVLQEFASVQIAAANFRSSICFRATEHLFSGQITYEDRLTGAEIVRASPKVTISYFTEGHTGSTAWWDESEGRKCLNQIARHLGEVGGVGYWSGNKIVRHYLEHWFAGRMVLPKMAGTNSLLEHTSCAIIYSNKAQRADDPLLDVFDIGRDDIKRARESEDIYQFVMRGALRKPAFGGGYEAYVYDREQAEALREHLLNDGITDDVTLVPVIEAGSVDVTRPGSQKEPQPDQGTHTQREEGRRAKDRERQARSREKKRAEREAAGTGRKPGRPRKPH